MSATIQFKRGTASEWSTLNPILADGEPGMEIDTLAYKIGDGVTAWNSLPYRELSGLFSAAMLLDAIADPSTPAAGKMNLYAKELAGRIMPKWKGPSGLDTFIQEAIYQNNIILICPSNTTLFTYIGTGTSGTVGTVSTPAILAGNFRTFQRRSQILSASIANSISEMRITNTVCYRGETIGGVDVGGFFMYSRFAVASATALQRLVVGLSTLTSPMATTQNPSALTSCIIFGNDSADTNYQIMHNDASGSCTKVNLGASFPVGNIDDVFDLTFFSAPNGTTVGYRVVNLRTGAVASGTISTDMPTPTTLLTYRCYLNNGGTAAAVTLDHMKTYIATDY